VEILLRCSKKSIILIIILFLFAGMASGYFGLPSLLLEKLCSPLMIASVLPFGETVSASDFDAEQMLFGNNGIICCGECFLYAVDGC